MSLTWTQIEGEQRQELRDESDMPIAAVYPYEGRIRAEALRGKTWFNGRKYWDFSLDDFLDHALLDVERAMKTLNYLDQH